MNQKTLIFIFYFTTEQWSFCQVSKGINAPVRNDIFFLSGFSFTDIDDSQYSMEREGTIFYSTLPLSHAHVNSDIYLQLSMRDDYHIFLIVPPVFTILLLHGSYSISNYHLADVVKYMVKSETAIDLRHKIKFLCPLKSKSYVTKKYVHRNGCA